MNLTKNTHFRHKITHFRHEITHFQSFAISLPFFVWYRWIYFGFLSLLFQENSWKIFFFKKSMFVAFLYIALILGFSHRVLFLELEADLVLWYTLWRLKRGGDDTNGPQRTPNPSTNHVHSRDSYLRKYSLALTNRRNDIKFNV